MSRLLDILGLTGLAAPAEQHNDQLTPLLNIDPITGAVMNAQFAHAFTDRLRVTPMPLRQTIEPGSNQRAPGGP